MAKKGVKVKELARELGVTSRRIIDRCREGGVWVQNSASRIAPDKMTLVRSWFSAASPPDSQLPDAKREEGPGDTGEGA